jgi:hypothetical protein
MKKLFYLTYIFLFIAVVSNAQYSLDYGAVVGASNYLGEIGGKEKQNREFLLDMKTVHTRWALGGFVRYRAHPMFNVRGMLTYGRITGDDANSTNPGRVARNLSFRNDMFELSGIGEANLYGVNDVGSTGRYRIDFRAYAFTGLGLLFHNPKAKSAVDGKWYALQPLRTEGQGIIPGTKPYSRFQPVIPIGTGFHYTFKRKYRIGAELAYRFTFTDYLDDISTRHPKSGVLTDPKAIELSNRTAEMDPSAVPADFKWRPGPGSIRGNPKDNDGYLFLTVNYSYVERGKSNFYRAKYAYLLKGKRKKRKTRAKF